MQELSAEWLPLAKDIASKWAKEYGYPLNDSHDLGSVAQFLAIQNQDDLSPKAILSNELKDIQPPNFSLEENRSMPHATLADFNLPIYITTNYDYFMEAALKSRGKDPKSEFCRWNNYAKAAGIPSVFDKSNKPQYRPTSAQPLVYHLHGVIDIPQSMVLTQNDYIDFIVNFNRENSILSPLIVRNTSSLLLLIGYKLQDINFNIIFRGIKNLLGASVSS